MLSDSTLMPIAQEIPQPTITKITLKIIYLKFHPYLPEANKLILGPQGQYKQTTMDQHLANICLLLAALAKYSPCSCPLLYVYIESNSRTWWKSVSDLE